jgi:hypothetical protein
VTLVGALAATAHVPGPSSGTTATSKRAVSCPLSAPLFAFSAGALATELAFDPVSLKESASDGPLVLVGVVTGLVRLAGGRVLVGAFDLIVVVVRWPNVVGPRFGIVVVVVVTVFECVVVSVVNVDRDAVSLVAFEGVDAVNVKTSTRRRSGLDHITQWVLLSVRTDLIWVLEG